MSYCIIDNKLWIKIPVDGSGKYTYVITKNDKTEPENVFEYYTDTFSDWESLKGNGKPLLYFDLENAIPDMLPRYVDYLCGKDDIPIERFTVCSKHNGNDYFYGLGDLNEKPDIYFQSDISNNTLNITHTFDDYNEYEQYTFNRSISEINIMLHYYHNREFSYDVYDENGLRLTWYAYWPDFDEWDYDYSHIPLHNYLIVSPTIKHLFIVKSYDEIEITNTIYDSDNNKLIVTVNCKSEICDYAHISLNVPKFLSG